MGREYKTIKRKIRNKIVTRTKYYHIQLHPEDSNFTVEHIKEILKIGYIGLDFGGNEYYYEKKLGSKLYF